MSPAPVYYLAGDDDLLLLRALEDLLDELRAALPDLEVVSVDAAEAAALPELRTGSLFGGTRCAVVRGAERLAGDAAAAVADYLEDPAAGAVLVLVAASTDRRKRLPKLAEKVGRRIEVRTPPPWAEGEWHKLVAAEWARAGRTAERAAVAALLDRAGTDPAAVASRCAQVAAAVPSGRRITAEDVAAVVEAHGSRGAFAVADAVTERDPAAALTALRGALEAGDHPVVVLGALAYRFRQLLQARAGTVPERVSSGQRHRLERVASRNFAPGELAWCHDRLARADVDIKSSDLPPALLLEVAVVEMSTRRPGRSVAGHAAG